MIRHIILLLMMCLAMTSTADAKKLKHRNAAMVFAQLDPAKAQDDPVRVRKSYRHRRHRVRTPPRVRAPIEVAPIPAPAPIMVPEPPPEPMKYDLASVRVDKFAPRFVDQQAWIDQEMPDAVRPEIVRRPPPEFSWPIFVFTFVIMFALLAGAAVTANRHRLIAAWRGVAYAYAEWKLNRRDVMEMTT